MTVPFDPFGELWARVEATSDRMDRDLAAGWLVVVVDLDPPIDEHSIVHAIGAFETPEQALVAAGEMDADPLGGLHPANGDPGWLHLVVPMLAPKTNQPPTTEEEPR